jgi:hypothetical protein
MHAPRVVAHDEWLAAHGLDALLETSHQHR